MVEVDPSGSSVERIAVVEEEIFQLIDGEIREQHNWSKDLVEQLTQRYETTATKHLQITDSKYQQILENRARFKELGRQRDEEALKERLLSILSTDENREPILIGTEAEFFNSNGQVIVSRVLKGLIESETAVKNRSKKLKHRLSSPNLTEEIQRKVKHPCSEFDQILSQYGEGSELETSTETFTRRLREWALEGCSRRHSKCQT